MRFYYGVRGFNLEHVAWWESADRPVSVDPAKSIILHMVGGERMIFKAGEGMQEVQDILEFTSVNTRSKEHLNTWALNQRST